MNPAPMQTEILLHLKTGDVRRNLITTDKVFRFHEGFTRAESEAGWKQVVCFGSGTSEDDMTAEIARIRAMYLHEKEKPDGVSAGLQSQRKEPPRETA